MDATRPDLGRHVRHGVQSPKGFGEVYGDYGEIAITDRGDTFAVWGEGASYFGRAVWYNREP